MKSASGRVLESDFRTLPQTPTPSSPRCAIRAHSPASHGRTVSPAPAAEKRTLHRFLQRQVMLRLRDYIVAPFPQRRHAIGDLRKPVIKVGSEPPFPHRRLQILIGGRNHTNVHRYFLHSADAIITGSVQHPQQLYLHSRIEIADLVEKKRTLISDLKQSLFARFGAAESAFLVAEKFAFEQILRQRPCAVSNPPTTFDDRSEQ